MSALAHPGGSIAPLTSTSRPYLSLVPRPAQERLAEVIRLPLPARRPAADRAIGSRPAASGTRSQARAPLRLTVRGRRVLVALTLALAAAAGSIAGSVMSAGSESSGEVAQVTVGAGDSLWSVAAAVAAPGEDVRDVMSEIVELNGLQGQSLAAGQVLTVPAAG